MLFADTFYYLALLNPHDSAHARATAMSRHMRDRTLTTPWVLTEVVDAMSAPNNRGLAVTFMRSLDRNARVTITSQSDDLFRAGMDLFSARTDKSWSLTDCISFVVMRDHGLTDALTADHHFEQAGFVALLK